MYKKFSFSALVFGTLMALNGCGGGGGSTGSNPVSSSSIKGVAVDDLILDGVVKAKDPNGNLLASGRTSDSDGTYTINVNYTGVVLVNVTCDENSTMYNPETKVESTCSSDVSLNSLGTVTAGSDLTVNISPLTEIVYQRAVALAGGDISDVDTDDVNDARNEIGLMFSVDPLADDPTDGTYAAIIGTIHTLADADPDTSVMDITNLLAEQLADGEADGSADDTLYALVQVMVDVGLTNNLVATDGTYLPPENPASLSDIDEAKALFDELRTQAMSLTDYTNKSTPGFLDTEALSMEDALNSVVMDVSLISNILSELNGAIKYAIDSDQNSEARTFFYDTDYGIIVTKNTTITSWNYQIIDLNNSDTSIWEGSVLYPEIDTSNILNFTTLTANVSGDMPLGFMPDSDITIVNSQNFDGSITANKTMDGTTFELAGTIVSNGTTINLSEMTAELAYDVNATTGEPILNYFKLNGITLQGIVDGYTIDGSIKVNSYVQNASLASKGGIEETALSGVSINFTCSGQPLSISDVSFTYDDITYTPDSINIYQNNAWFGFYNIVGNLQESEILSSLTHDASCPSGGSLTIQSGDLWTDVNSEIGNSGWVPNDITFAGAITRTGASIEGTLRAKWLNAETIDLEQNTEIVQVPFLDITLDGKLQMPERPEILMSLSYENNATHNTLGARYTYDTTVINAEGVFDTDMLNGDVAITTHIGIRADIDLLNGAIVYDGASTVTKDGLLIGEFEDREGLPVIKYTDGSFESIF